MDVLAGAARTSQATLLAEIFHAAAEFVSAIRARDEIRAQALAEGVETIRAALAAGVDASENSGLDDEMELLRQVAAIMNNP